MAGKAFEDGDRLDKLAAGLSGLQHFFDGTYKAMTDRQRFSKRDREFFNVVVEKYEEGSFVAILGAIYSGLQLGLPIAQAFTPADLWGYTVNAFKFLEHIFTLAHAGKEVSISQDGDGNTVVTSGDQITHYHGPVFKIGTQIIGSLRELDDVLEDNVVKKIGLGNSSPTDINLLSENKGLFYPPKTIDETPLSLTCDIFDFNKYENQGRARVAPEQKVPEGNYKFRNIGTQDVEKFILSMTESRVEFNCLVQYEHDPLSDSRISSLLVTDVRA